MRTCIFCEERANSKEDVWPVWLLEQLGRNRTTEIVAEMRHGTHVWRGGAGVTVKRVCRTCNNEWMSRLEEEAQPLLSRLIGGTPVDASVGQQLTLARWSQKTAMVFDALATASGESMFFSQAERDHLRSFELGAVAAPFPRFTHFWLAAYRGERAITSSGALLSGIGDRRTTDTRESRSIDGYTFTISAGCVVLQSVTTRVPPEHAAAATYIHAHANRWERFAKEIWPFHGLVTFPPSETLDDASNSLDDFAGRWSPAAVEQDT